MSGRRLLVLSAFSGLGGAELSLLDMIRATAGSLEVVVALPDDGPLRPALVEAGARAVVVAWPRVLLGLGERGGARAMVAGLVAVPGLAIVVGALAALSARERVHLIASNGIKAHLLGILVRRFVRVPLVWYLRDGLEARPKSSRLLALASRGCDGAIAISRYVAGEARRVIGPRARVALVYNCIDVERFRPGSAPAPDLVKGPGEVWFAVVGALAPLKGQDCFLAAARTVAVAVPSARFIVVGSDLYQTGAGRGFADGLRRMAEHPALSGRVQFLGQRTDLERVLAHVDVLVQPNRGPEGLGRAVIEALACGVPVVAVDRWGPAEIVEHEHTGLLVPPGDVDRLAGAMLRMAGDQSLRSTFAAAARQSVRSRFSPAAFRAAFLAAFDGFARGTAGTAA